MSGPRRSRPRLRLHLLSDWLDAWTIGRTTGVAMKRLRLIGVPSSAGAHAPGVERGPEALRLAGLTDALESAGIPYDDAGDLPAQQFATTPAPSGARNLPAVLESVRQVAEAVAAARAADDIAVLLGGDCTLVLGAVAGLGQQGRVGVFYLDGDADLDTPQEGWGVLDSCVVAHLLGDGDPALAGDQPLLDPADLVLFGFQPAQLSAGQWRRYAGHRLYGAPVTDIEPGTAGERAGQDLLRLRDKDALVCHFDADVIDYADFPLADCPRYDGGLSIPDTFDALEAAARHPGLACLTITEVNPDHDPDGSLARALVTYWVDSLAAADREPDG